MSEEKKLSKKKSSPSSKKSGKVVDDNKDKSVSKKSSANASKKGSPNVSHEEIDPEKGQENNQFGKNSVLRFPNYGESQKIPNQLSERPCVHHNQPLRYYCEACEEPICEECQYSGPHNTELHRISTLQEAFDARCNYLRQGTYGILLEKR